MKVLIADGFEQIGLDGLREFDFEIVHRPQLSADDLAAALAEVDPDVLVVRSTKVRADAIAAGARLKLIVRAGAGFDTIDVAKASAEGIYVANCPGKNAIAVAELTWALILCCDRRVPDQTAELRAGTWNKKEYGKAAGLHGRTLGLIGLGPIGQAVATRGRAFGMKVIAWSRSLSTDRAIELGVTRMTSALEVARQADVISIHVASTPDTAKLVDGAMIAAMKPGTIVINTSRGAVVDETALREGVERKHLRAGLDVFAAEPGGSTGAFTSDLVGLPGVYGTHHVGASTAQAQNAIAMEAVHIIATFRDSGVVPHCVNRAKKTSATCMLTVRHRNRPGVLAKVFDVLSQARINVEEMENVLYEGHEAACARIQLATTPTQDQLTAIQSSCGDILGLELTDFTRA